MLRVRAGPKALRAIGGSYRETARERKLTGRNTLPAVRRTKGLSKSREEPAGGGPAHPPPEAEGRGEGKGANSAPETASLPNGKQDSSF